MSGTSPATEASYITIDEYQRRYPYARLYYEVTDTIIARHLKDILSKEARVQADHPRQREALFGIAGVSSMRDGTVVFSLNDTEKNKPDFEKRWTELTIVFPGDPEHYTRYKPSESEEGVALTKRLDIFYEDYSSQLQDLELDKNVMLSFPKYVLVDSPARPSLIALDLDHKVEVIGDHVIVSLANAESLSYMMDHITLVCIRNEIIAKAVDIFQQIFNASAEELGLKKLSNEDYGALLDAAQSVKNDQALDDILFGTDDQPQSGKKRARQRGGPRP